MKQAERRISASARVTKEFLGKDPGKDSGRLQKVWVLSGAEDGKSRTGLTYNTRAAWMFMPLSPNGASSMHDPNWKEMADAILRIWSGMAWQALLGVGLVILAWKFLDAWGKKPKA